MNILQIQDRLKDMSDQQLGGLLQAPNGAAPQYLVMTELQRRKEMRKKVEQEAPKQSMAEEAVAGLAALPVPQGMAPIAERAGVPPQGMYGGGVVRMSEGGSVRLLDGYSRQELFEFVARGQAPAGYTVADVNSALGRPESVSVSGAGDINSNPQTPTLQTELPPPNRGGLLGTMGAGTTSPSRLGRGNPGRYGYMGPPLAELEAQAAESERERRVDDVLQGQERAGLAAERSSELAVRARENAIRDIRGRISGGTFPEEAIRDALPGYRGVTEAEMRQAFGVPVNRDTAQQQAAPNADPMRGMTRDYLEGANSVERPPPPGGAPRGGAGQVGIASFRAAPGGTGGQGGGTASSTRPPPSPTPPESGAEAASPSESRFAALRRQIEEGRGSSKDERREAQNMALIEAGLRIAGSQSPHFAAAISEGAGALGSYARQVADIRRGDRENLATQITLENAETTNEYRRGDVAARNRGLDMQQTDSDRRFALAQRRAEGAGGSRMDDMMSTFKALFGVDYDARNPEHQRNMLGLMGRAGREPTVERFSPQYTAIGKRVSDLEALAGNATTSPEVRNRAQTELNRLYPALRRLEDSMTGGTPDPLGLR